jgi:hypothetical protein
MISLVAQMDQLLNSKKRFILHCCLKYLSKINWPDKTSSREPISRLNELRKCKSFQSPLKGFNINTQSILVLNNFPCSYKFSLRALNSVIAMIHKKYFSFNLFFLAVSSVYLLTSFFYSNGGTTLRDFRISARPRISHVNWRTTAISRLLLIRC